MDGVRAEVGQSADPRRQVVTVDGRRVAGAPLAYWIAHKPRDVLTTTRDPRGRKTVVELLPPDLPPLFPVGRLDRNTEGLVLLTNDGALAHTLLHPSFGNEREYRVTARGRVSMTSLRRLAAGIELDDGRTAPARVGEPRYDPKRGTTTVGLTLGEGRKRQIRRAFEALEHPVLRLVRTRIGPLRLTGLPRGQARALRPDELRSLRRHAKALRAARGDDRQGERKPSAQARQGSDQVRNRVSKPPSKNERSN